MKRLLTVCIVLFAWMELNLFAGGMAENTTYAKTNLERNDLVSTYLKQVAEPHTMTNGELELTAVPLLSETYVLSEYPDMKIKRYNNSQIVSKLEARTKALDRQQGMSGIFYIILRCKSEKGLLEGESFTVDPDFFEYMFLDNDKGEYLRVSSHSLRTTKNLDARNTVLEFWVTFGESEEERKQFFQDSKTISTSVADFGFAGQVIKYTLPLSGIFSNMPEEPKELLKSMRSSLKVTFDGADTPALTGQILGSMIGDPEKPFRKGYTFDGWYKDASHTKVWDFKKDVILDDTMLYAKWVGNDYLVTLDSQGGVLSETQDKLNVVFGGTYCALPIPIQADHYTFSGWWTGKNGTGQEIKSNSSVTVAKDQILYANWKILVGKSFGPAGGYVFYDKGSYSEGWRYLEAAPASNEYNDKVWGGSGTTVGGTGAAIGTGAGNTEKIVAKFGNAEPYGKKTDYAAKVCADLVLTKDGVVYDDWFLPSEAELDQMYRNLKRNQLGGFSADSYWSSSEHGYGSSFACHQRFNYGEHGNGTRSNGARVRPIRAF